jgi:hypothetical protein
MLVAKCRGNSLLTKLESIFRLLLNFISGLKWLSSGFCGGDAPSSSATSTGSEVKRLGSYNAVACDATGMTMQEQAPRSIGNDCQ